MLSLCAVLSGADDCEEMQNYCKQKERLLRTFLELPNGIPSHDTINRVYNHVDKDKFADCLLSKELLVFMDCYQVNIDGKVLRATGKEVKACRYLPGVCLGAKPKTGTKKSRG